MFSITPIGSCRINTPLRIAEKTYGFRRNMDRIYGFSHCSAEAVQQVKFLLGEYIPSPLVEPYISPNQSIAELLQTPHELSDMYIVELSSAKRLTIDRECVQLNYLTRSFPAFFADKYRASQFWRLATNGNQDAIDRFLVSFVKDATITPQDRDIMRKLRFKMTTAAELRSDVDYLMQTLPAVLFVSHVNALKTDGFPIASREKYIDQVKFVVKGAGGLLCDPTEMMKTLGQEFAIEDNSTSLAHYTEGFSKVLFDDWYQQAISRRFDDLAASDTSPERLAAVVSDLSAQVDMGNLKLAKPRIDAAIEHFGAPSELVALQACCLQHLEQDEKADQALKASLAENPDDIRLLTMLFQRAVDKGDTRDALTYHTRVTELEQVLPADAVLGLARTLEQGAELPKALQLLNEVMVRSQITPAAIETLARVALALDDHDGLETCKGAILGNPAGLDAILALKVLMRSAIPDQTVTFLTRLAQKTPTDFIPALAFLDDEKRGDLVAAAIAAHAEEHPAFLKTPFVNKILARWNTQLKQNIPTKQKFGIIGQIQKISEMSKATLATGKKLRTATLANVRELVKSGDVAALESLLDESLLAVPPVIETPVYLARHHFIAGRYQKSLDLSLAVLRVVPDHLASWVMAMRSAVKTGDYLMADQAAQRIIEMNEQTPVMQVDEARKRRDRLSAQCLHAARQEEDLFKAWQLCEITARSERLLPKARHEFRKLEKRIGIHVRELYKADDPDFLEFTLKAADLIPDSGVVIQSLGRHFVRKGDFAQALPYWERLAELEFDHEATLFQLQRCKARLAGQEQT